MTTGNSVNVQNFVQMYTVTGVDGKVVAATKIMSTSGQGRFTPLSITFELANVAGYVSAITASVGTNAILYNDVMLAVAIPTITTVNSLQTNSLSTNAISIPPSTDVYLNITVAAVAGTFNLKVSITGFYN